MTRPDVLVVGAGGSGAPFAARLAQAGIDVLLVESGPIPDDRALFPAELLDASRLRGADPAHPDTWEHHARLAPGRDHTIIRGRIAGGSTATNGGYFVRPAPDDLELWTDRAPEWRPERIRAAMARLERDLDLGGEPGHGTAGPMPVSRPGATHPVSLAFERACLDAGLDALHDANADASSWHASGVAALPMDVVDGVRWNTALGYLLGGLAPGPRLLRGTVRRVLLEGGRAVGVLVEHPDGRAQRIEAGEVVLSAGALLSPQLLLDAGIGPARSLEAAGRAVVVDSPGVGASLSDHPQVPVSWRPRRPLTTESATAMESVAWTGSAEFLPLLAPVPTLLTGGSADGTEPFTTLVSLSHPVGRGSLMAKAAGSGAESGLRFDVDLGYLAEAEDRAALRDAVRFAADVHASPAFEDVSAGLVDLDPATLDDDAALDGWVATHLGTSVHTCATLPVGPAADPASVVDASGRVYGVKGLRVVDTSILPRTPSRGPACSAVILGELVAEVMLRGGR